ncbi:MAG: glutaredoxin domain-containing protein, partial [Bdellovibrionota bacterium]
MKKLKVYEYSGCSTCKKALKFLDSKGIAYDKIDITAQAPTKAELQAM